MKRQVHEAPGLRTVCFMSGLTFSSKSISSCHCATAWRAMHTRVHNELVDDEPNAITVIQVLALSHRAQVLI